MTACTYRGWDVSYDHPPIPTRMFDWSATSPEYDVDCDQYGFFRCGGEVIYAESYELLCQEIDAAIEEADQ